MEATKQDIWQALNGLQGFARRLERELRDEQEKSMMAGSQLSALRLQLKDAEKAILDLARAQPGSPCPKCGHCYVVYGNET